MRGRTATINCSIDELKSTYDRDGFVIIRGYLSAEELQELREQAGRFFEENPLEGGKLEGRKKGLLKNMQNHDSWFMEQLLDGKHVPMLKTLLEDDLEPATAAWFDKPPGEANVIASHFDAVGNPRVPRTGCTIWIALDKADVGNGCLFYAAGSHNTVHENKMPLEGFEDSDKGTPAEVEPGDAVVHNALTVHWSGVNGSDGPRRAVSFFYWGASSKIDPDYFTRN